ncbi:MAG: agmatine deiminase family protein [Campylobacteraceae bacterium]|nr:agmatine deiminase family protein [Campylobacteraceae bacterium]
MINRRKFIYATSILSISVALNANSNFIKTKNTDFLTFFMPEEAEKHERTWMSFVANDYIWEEKQIPEVKRNLALIAQTIAKYEPVSILVSKNDKNEAIELLAELPTPKYPITLFETEIDDLWLRDTAPTFVYNQDHKKFGIDFNFNGWGEDQEHELDSKVTSFICKKNNIPILNTALILEGGSFEIDGEGIAILTESSVLNDNRNPNWTKTEVEEELKYLLGLEKIIWLKGIKGKDITDGHVDFYARFTSPGEIVVAFDPDETSYDHQVTKENINILKEARDLNDKAFKLNILEAPIKINEEFGYKDFAAGYIGYYVCNGAVIMQSFGDENADRKAKKTLENAFPNKKIEQIRIDGIASGGGSIHCATQQEPINL